MIKTQTWKPDTCECHVEEQYDNSIENAEMTCSKVLKKCSAHIAVADADLFGVLYSNPDGENKRKNLVHKYLLETDSLGLAEDVVQKDGSTIRTLKAGVKYDWSFSGTGKDRVLNAEIKGATLAVGQKNNLKTFCDSTLGVNKVNII